MRAGQRDPDQDRMRDAARLNWRLWTIIQSELLDPSSPVPLDIRNNVLSLARFVDRQTIDFLADPLPDKLTPLIAINRELAAGLQDPVAAAATAGRPADAGGDPVRAPAMRLSI